MLDLRKFLAMPAAYRLFAALLRKPDTTSRIVAEHLKVAQGMRVLDVGCGPGQILNHLPAVDYIGIDISPDYVAAARARHGSNGIFDVRAVDADITFSDLGSFDLIFGLAIVHHLDDAASAAFFRAARAALRPAGRCVTLDNVYVPEQSAAARWIISRDRGEHVRAPEGYKALAAPYFPTIDVKIIHDLLRIPYTHIIMDCRA